MSTKPRLIAIDLDGTLLNSQGHVSEGNARALQRAVAAGLLMVPATARWYQAACRPFTAIGLDVAAIASAGADVRLAGGEVAEQRTLAPDFVAFVAELCDRAGWVATFATPKLAYRRASELPAWAANAPEWMAPVTHLRDANLQSLLSIIVELRPDDASFAELAPWGGSISMHRAQSFTGDTLLTITATEVDKGSALLALCRATGIDPAETIAIGDSDVDLPLFARAGRAIAMGNASDTVKAAAHTITAPADEDGVAQALDALL